MKNKADQNLLNYCPLCDEPVLKGTEKIMIPLEVPYLNFYMHKDCYNAIYGEFTEFLMKNIDKILENM